MFFSPHRGLVVLSFTVLALVGYGMYLGQRDANGQGPKKPWIEGRAPSTSSTSAPSALPSDTMPATKSMSQLHTDFREAQQCAEEVDQARIDAINDPGVVRPKKDRCIDMKYALRRLFEATKAAAKSGDTAAQMCYLMQSDGDRDSGFTLSDAEIAEFQSVAPHYVDAAFQRGDWRVIDLLGFHVVDSFGLFIFLDQWKDPAREYKAHQLFLLGASDVESQDADGWLAALRRPDSKHDQALTAQERTDSDAWAQQTYDQYFSSQPKLLKEPRACTAEDGDE